MMLDVCATAILVMKLFLTAIMCIYPSGLSGGGEVGVSGLVRSKLDFICEHRRPGRSTMLNLIRESTQTNGLGGGGRTV